MILAAGLARGLRMEDADVMTIGMWVDYVIEYNNLNYQDEKGKKDTKNDKKKATQADFDRF